MRRLAAFARSLGIRPMQAVGIVLLVLLLSQAIALAMLSGPLLLMHIFDGVMETRNYSTLFVLAAMFIMAQLLGMMVRVSRQTIMQAGVAVVERKLFLNTLRAAVRLARDGQPEQASSTLSDFAMLRRFLNSSALPDLMALLALPLPLYFMFRLHPWLGWLALLGCAVMCAFSVVTERQGRAALQQASAISAKATSTLARHLRRHDEVFGLGLLPGIVRHWLPLRREALTLNQTARSRSEVLMSISSAVSMITVSAAAALSAYLVIHHQTMPATFAASLHVVARLLGPCESVALHWNHWSKASVSFARLQQVLAGIRRGQPALPDEQDPALHILSLRLEVPGSETVLVDDLQLHAPPGTVVAVTGRNAAGKSSLLRALVGLTTPAAGAVVYRSAAMHEVERATIGPHIGFMAQRAQLLQGNLLDNISRFSGDTEGAIRAARLSGAHEMIGRLPEGYSTLADAGAGLSGGQQRQVALARALFGDPGLVVLDEPEVGLDPPAMAALVAAVAEVRERGAIVFLVTHDLKCWDGVADLELRLAGRGAWTTNVLQQRTLLPAHT